MHPWKPPWNGVVVNDANGRFFEPAAPRSLLLAVRLVKAGW